MSTTVEELKAIGINSWEDVKNDFNQPDLLLGNGFSINLANSLHYNSLFDEFLRANEHSRAIFEAFHTSNFELIMEWLDNAQKVNGIFDIESTVIESSRAVLRDGLIQAIEAKHPRKTNVNWQQLQTISQAFDNFGDIFTLNYDALLYHIIMIGVDRHTNSSSIRPYNDYFWKRIDSRYLEFQDYQDIKKYKHVYYLHGALFIFKPSSAELKIKSYNGDELVECIAHEIAQSKFPLFVSEGSAKDKELAISRSSYLSFALRKLKETDKSLVIYGTSLSDPDKHIVTAINRRRRNIAYAVYVKDKTQEQLQAELKIIQDRLTYNIKLEFFDASTLFFN